MSESSLNKQLGDDPVDERVRDTLAKVLYIPKEEISLADHLIRDLGADSFAMLEVRLALESAFGCRIPEEHLKALLQVASIVEFFEGA